MNLVDKARKFAEQAHKTQARKYTGEPYFVHLDEVAKLCAKFGLSKRAIAAAYLHDTVEDQPITHEELVGEFGREVAEIVRDLTDVSAVVGGPTRKRRKLLDLDRLANASAEAQSIKCADMISNTSSIVRHDVPFARTYLPEKRAILTVLSRANHGLLALAWERLVEAEKQVNA